MSYYFTKGRSNDVAIVLIGIMDIISGIIIYFSRGWNLTSNRFILFFMFFYFSLGIWTLATNIAKRKYYEWRGIIDIIIAISFTLIYYGNVYSIFQIIGIVIALKGIIGMFLLTTKE